VTELDVDKLPRRVAHAVHALLEASGPYAFNMGVLKPSEVMLYDAEAMSVSSTGNALRRAMRYGLVDRAGYGLYFPTLLALEHRRAFEDRYHRDTARDGDD
jgi:hypothetical protein